MRQSKSQCQRSSQVVTVKMGDNRLVKHVMTVGNSVSFHKRTDLNNNSPYGGQQTRVYVGHVIGRRLNDQAC